jgi:hypothetical protein
MTSYASFAERRPLWKVKLFVLIMEEEGLVRTRKVFKLSKCPKSI